MSSTKFVNKATRQLRQSGVPLARAAVHAGRRRRQSPLVLMLSVACLALLAGGAAMALVVLKPAAVPAPQTAAVVAPSPAPIAVATPPQTQTPFAASRREPVAERAPDTAVILSNLKAAPEVTASAPAPAAAPGLAAADAPPNCLRDLNTVAQAMNVTFGVSSNALDPATTVALDDLATKVAQCDGVQIVVAGHSDTTGSPEANVALSWQRADEVVAAIVTLGHDPALFNAVGYGARNPVVKDGAVDDAASRRVEFMVTMASGASAAREATQ